MLVDETCVHVEVLDLHFYQVGFVAPVERLDVALHGGHKLLPLEVLLLVDGPPLGVHVVAGLSEEGGVVHHLLRDATNVDTGTAKTPLVA